MYCVDGTISLQKKGRYFCVSCFCINKTALTVADVPKKKVKNLLLSSYIPAVLVCASDFGESCDQLNEMGLSAPDVMEPGFLFMCLKPWPGTWLLFFTTQFFAKWRFPGSYGDAQRCGMPSRSTWWAFSQFTLPLVWLVTASTRWLLPACFLMVGKRHSAVLGLCVTYSC